MPWQEVPETPSNCRVFGRIMYCGEKFWIQGDTLLPSGENACACLPSRASRVRVPSPAPSLKNPGLKASPEIGARQSLYAYPKCACNSPECGKNSRAQILPPVPTKLVPTQAV